ncbi:MAG: YicC family protein [Ignavibacteriae bacterium]|nr:YicC family protein [Ignavibacteriota bacterium]
MLSMTGFGRDTFSNDNITIETEVKSLNSRFLDISLRLPRELYVHEFAIRDIIKKNIKRGKISLNVTMTLSENSLENTQLDPDEFNITLETLKQIKTLGSINEEIKIEHLLSLGDKFLNNEKNDIEVEFDIIANAIKSALDNLIEMRTHEGLELKKDIDSRIEKIVSTTNLIEELVPNSTKEYFENFKEKASKLLETFVTNDERLYQELAILSEKHDVTEECVRLKSHIKLFNETTKNSIDVGRKLNFICQEMNREANTINSKSASTEISHKGIIIKEELEKIREQVQNIE